MPNYYPFRFRSRVRNLASLDDAELQETFHCVLKNMGTVSFEATEKGRLLFHGTLQKVHARTPKVTDTVIPGRGFWNRQPLCRYALAFAYRRDGNDVTFDVDGQVVPNRAFAFNVLFAVGVWLPFYLSLPADPTRAAWALFLIFILGLLVFLQVTQQILVRRFFRHFLSDRPVIGIAAVYARKADWR